MALLKKKQNETDVSENKRKKPKKEKAPKKEKKPLEPQYFTSQNNMRTYNYRVYHMPARDKLLYFLLAFAVGAVVGYLFYGGIGKDEFGNPTLLTRILDLLIPGAVGFAAGTLFVPIRTEQILQKKRDILKRQFRDMLETLTTILGAGSNVPMAFESTYNDLKVQYDENAPILEELHIINMGIRDNIRINELLADFGERSGIEDIKSFARVFEVAAAKGSDVRDIIRNTYNILSDKMEISEDIETVLTGNKSQQNIMIVMPVVLIAMIKMMSPDFAANFVTPAGVIATTIGVAMFVGSYYLGKTILEIKV